MKILLLTTHLNVGGIGVYTTGLARHLKRLGLDVLVVSSGGELLPELEKDSIRHIEADIKTKSEVGPKVWKAVPKISSIVRDEKIDLIHAQTRVTQVIAQLVKKLAGVPYVATCHGFFNHKRLSRRFFPCWGDKTIAISGSVKDHLVDDLGVKKEQVDIVYNGIEVDRYKVIPGAKDTELCEELSISENTPVVGALGRLSIVKGYTYLIDAFSNVRARGVDCRLLFVGDGPEKQALSEQAKAAGVEKDITMIPGGGDLVRYFSLMDVFCMPSVHEGLGLALMEAMASGKACIASDIGGLAELIEDNVNGLLVPSQDPGPLAAAIEKLLSDRNLSSKLASRAREKALKEFAIEDSAKKTVEVYEKAIRK